MRTNLGVAASTILLVVLCFPPGASRLDAQTPAAGGEKLQFVAVLSRHGVRTPINTPEDLQGYAPQPWPLWDAPAGEMTTRGGKLMELLGGYYREYLTQAGLLAPKGCTDRDKVYFWADAMGRDIQSAWLLGRAMMPDCNITVHRLAATPDPLFSPGAAGVGKLDVSVASGEFQKAAGGSAEATAKRFNADVNAVEQILFGCSPSATCPAAGTDVKKRIRDQPASQPKGAGLSMPAIAAAFAIDQAILLQYQEGLAEKDIAWGRFSPEVRKALEDFEKRYWELTITPYASKARSSNLLSHMLRAIAQAAQGSPVPGALGRPGDKALFVLGHDTDIRSIAEMLGLSWEMDQGRAPNETLPGCALVFELWRNEATGAQSVRTYFLSQTSDQMQRMTPLDLRTPPLRVRLSPTGCGTDASCEWSRFRTAVESAIDPAFVGSQ